MPAGAQGTLGCGADANLILELLVNQLEKVYTDKSSRGILKRVRMELEKAIETGTVTDAHKEAARQLNELNKPRVPSGSGGRLPPSTDPGTGLPMRAEAEEMVQQMVEARPGKQAYAVVFYLHRMALTNARFGEAIGNQVILFCSQHIATAVLRATDHLFRWQGPSFVAIIERPESLQAVSSEIQRLAAAPISRHFETPSRSVYLPIRLTSEVVPLFETTTEDVLSQIGRFILNTSGQNEKD
jgi:GGDEF domain-containing protein